MWINFDDDAPGLEEFLGDYDVHLAPIAMDRMRLRWWKYTIVPANWKVALEAFLEAYHVMQTHPELTLGATGEDYNVDGIKYTPTGWDTSTAHPASIPPTRAASRCPPHRSRA